MTEERTHHRHRRPSGKLRRALPWVGWGLLVAILGGNLLVGLLRSQGGTPEGFLTLDLLLRVGFWAPIAFVVCISAAGVYWASCAWSSGGRSSHLWMRRGAYGGLAVAFLLVLAVFEDVHFPREWLAVVAAVLVAAQSFFLGMAALREYRRAEGGEGHRHGSRRSGSSARGTPPPPPTDAPKGPDA